MDTPFVKPTALREPRPFTVSEYHALRRAGILAEDDRVELLEGHILLMSPIGSRHADCVDRLTELFVVRTRPYAKVRVQGPIHLSERSEPEPDVALLQAKDLYAARHPRPDEVLLVVEVADTSLAFDRQVKVPLYARAGIPEVWLVVLEEDVLEVYRRPGAQGYAEMRTLSRGERTEIDALPEAGTFDVEALLGA